MEFIKLFFIGIVVGVANIIPGVSGGTIAVVFNIYDRLVSVITIKIKYILSQWKFWLPVGLGMVVGIVGFSKVLTILFEKWPMQTNLFFTGIIAGSLPLIIRKIKNVLKQEQSEQKKLPLASTIITCVLSVSLMIFLSFYKLTSTSTIVYDVLTLPVFLIFFASGLIAAIAMIIPGISGSFILLAIGTYSSVLKAVSQMNIPLLIPVALGIIVGLLAGALLVRVLMAKLPSQTYSAILGLVFGSLFSVIPFQLIQNNIINGQFTFITCLISVLCLSVGFFVAWFSSRKS